MLSINHVLTEVFFVFFIVGLWTFFIFKIVLYNVNILPVYYIFFKTRGLIFYETIYKNFKLTNKCLI